MGYKFGDRPKQNAGGAPKMFSEVKIRAPNQRTYSLAAPSDAVLACSLRHYISLDTNLEAQRDRTSGNG